MRPLSRWRVPQALRLLCICLCLGLSGLHEGRAAPLDGAADALDIYLNADLTHTYEVGGDLRLGLLAGLAVGAARYGGPALDLIVRDHRNNMRRTAKTIEEALENSDTLALVGGMHTPHYLKHGPRINEEALVLMLPWSAGATLTRLVDGPQNHIFRVSVDDSKAAPFLAQQTAAQGCERVATLALDNGWGRGNATALAAHVPMQGPQNVHQGFLRRDAGRDSVAVALSETEVFEPDCVILVLAARTSAYVVNQLATWSSPPKVLSHWGMLGGGFEALVEPAAWERLDVSVLSTCVLQVAASRELHVVEAIEAASKIDTAIATMADLRSPMAFAHAYDIGLLLRAAIAQAQSDARWALGREERSTALRDTLLELRVPVEGILKRYVSPYAPFGVDTPDGHEALGVADLCLARKRQDGRLEAYERGVAR